MTEGRRIRNSKARAGISAGNVVAKSYLYSIQITRLHEEAAESRLRVVESQLSIAFTLCAIAETQMKYSRLDEATQLLKRLQHHAKTIRLHLDEPDHLPKAAVPDLRKQLTKLEERTEDIESRLRQP